jgi:hypothetical protein
MGKPTVEQLVDGARRHGKAAGSEGEVSDLQVLFMTAFGLLNGDQVAAFFTDPEVEDLMELPEYEGVGD